MNPSPLQLKADWQYDQSGARQHYVIEARLDDRHAGRAYGWFEAGGRFVLEKIEMEPAQRSKGYGSAIIEQLRAQARERGCTEFVFQGVRTANRRAIKLYESLGAVPQPTSPELVSFIITPP